MPVVTVESLKPPGGDPSPMLAALPADLATAIGCDEGDVWVYFCEVSAVSVGGERREFHGHSPVVTVRARAWRSEEQVRAGMQAVARSVSSSLGVPLEDVWVHWLELPPGRVFAGGEFR